MAAPGAFWWPALGRVRATVRLIQPGALPRSAAVLVLFAINEIAACACLAWPRGRFAFKRCSTQSSANPGQPLARRAMTAPGAFWWPALGRVRAARALDPLPGAGGQGCAQPGVAGLLGPCCCCRAAGQPLAGCVPPCARSSSMHCPALVARAVLLPAVLVLPPLGRWALLPGAAF